MLWTNKIYVFSKVQLIESKQILRIIGIEIRTYMNNLYKCKFIINNLIN